MTPKMPTTEQQMRDAFFKWASTPPHGPTSQLGTFMAGWEAGFAAGHSQGFKAASCNKSARCHAARSRKTFFADVP